MLVFTHQFADSRVREKDITATGDVGESPYPPPRPPVSPIPPERTAKFSEGSNIRPPAVLEHSAPSAAQSQVPKSTKQLVAQNRTGLEELARRLYNISREPKTPQESAVDMVQYTGQLFKISSLLQTLSDAQSNQQYADSFYRVSWDFNMIVQSIHSTLDVALNMIRPNQWWIYDALISHFQDVEMAPFALRLQWYYNMIEGLLDQLEGYDMNDALMRNKSKLKQLYAIQTERSPNSRDNRRYHSPPSEQQQSSYLSDRRYAPGITINKTTSPRVRRYDGNNGAVARDENSVARDRRSDVQRAPVVNRDVRPVLQYRALSHLDQGDSPVQPLPIVVPPRRRQSVDSDENVDQPLVRRHTPPHRNIRRIITAPRSPRPRPRRPTRSDSSNESDAGHRLEESAVQEDELDDTELKNKWLVLYTGGAVASHGTPPIPYSQSPLPDPQPPVPDYRSPVYYSSEVCTPIASDVFVKRLTLAAGKRQYRRHIHFRSRRQRRTRTRTSSSTTRTRARNTSMPTPMKASVHT